MILDAAAEFGPHRPLPRAVRRIISIACSMSRAWVARATRAGRVDLQREVPPRTDEVNGHRQPPIRTVGRPGRKDGRAAAGQVADPGGRHAADQNRRTSGRHDRRRRVRVPLPGTMQMWGVPTVAAGLPPMRTVGTPGGPMTPGCPVGSPTRLLVA